MATHWNTHKVRPFMSKQTFDQVSAVMWGQNALDYYTNYINPRLNWDDSDIHDEAVYFAGFARGLRVGTLQNSSRQTMTQHAQMDVARDIGKSQGGPGNLASGECRSFDAAFWPSGANQAGFGTRIGTPIPAQNMPAASMNATSHGPGMLGGEFGCGSEDTPYGSIHYYVPDSHLAHQPANLNILQAQDQDTTDLHEGIPTPGSTTLSVSRLDHSTSVPARKGESIMAPLLEDMAAREDFEISYNCSLELKLPGENDYFIDSGFEDDIEKWFEELAGREWWVGFWDVSRRFPAIW